MDNQVNPRPLFEIIERARPAVRDEDIRRLVDGGLTPSAVHTLIYESTGGDKKSRERRAMTSRWLAILKRDYPEEYEKLIIENSKKKQIRN